ASGSAWTPCGTRSSSRSCGTAAIHPGGSGSDGACPTPRTGAFMRVLITGHQGYIGSVLAPMLAAAGHDCVGLDTGYFAACKIGEIEEVPTTSKDVRYLEPADLDGFDAVVHLAGLSNDPLGSLDPALTNAINL